MAFHSLEKLVRLHDGYRNNYQVEGQKLLLIQYEGQVFIIENRCPHMDVPLDQAELLGGQLIRCRAHGISFELNSGRACGPLAGTLDCLKKFTPIYEGDSIGVDL